MDGYIRFNIFYQQAERINAVVENGAERQKLVET